jgi:hypothetical protein
VQQCAGLGVLLLLQALKLLLLHLHKLLQLLSN